MGRTECRSPVRKGRAVSLYSASLPSPWRSVLRRHQINSFLRCCKYVGACACAAVALAGGAPHAGHAQAAVPVGRVVGTITADLPPGPPVQVVLAPSVGRLLLGEIERMVSIPGPGPFMMEGVPAGDYAIAAFMDVNRNGRVDRGADVYAVRREPITVRPDVDAPPVVFDHFFNTDPRGMVAPAQRQVLLSRVQFLYQGTVGLGQRPEFGARHQRRLLTARLRLRNVAFWSARPGTEAEWRHLNAQVSATAGALQTLAAGGDPAARERGPVRRATLSAAEDVPWPYALYIPPKYDPARAWPLFVVLHGAGGNEDRMLRTACGAGEWGDYPVPGRAPFPPFPERDAFILCPFGITTATPHDGFARNVDDVTAAMDAVIADYRIDPRRTYLTGFSMGGGGTWRIGLTHAERFAAVAPIAGTLPLPLSRAGDAPQLPVVVIHGRHDHVTTIAQVRAYVGARRAQGGRVVLREQPDKGHFLDMFGMDEVFAELEAAGASREWTGE